MKKYAGLLVASFLFIFNPSYSQHQIQMINGKTIEAENYHIGEIFVTYSKSGDKKSGSRAVDRYDVFSIRDTAGNEEVLYAPVDSLDFSVEEARLFIKGELAAKEYYNSNGPSISSVVGAGSSILYFYALPVPMLYSVILGRFNPKNMHLPENYDQQIANNEAFRVGYDKAARNIKIQKSLKWGYIGLGAGLAGWIIYGISNH